MNQRLNDLKKTLQKEFSSAKSVEGLTEPQKEAPYVNPGKLCQNCGGKIQGSIIMDEVNFTYLKHVIVKFLTSREVNSFIIKHLKGIFKSILLISFSILGRSPAFNSCRCYTFETLHGGRKTPARHTQLENELVWHKTQPWQWPEGILDTT